MMCRPKHFGLHYSINSWMKLNNPVDPALALEQWNILADRLTEHDVEIVNIRPEEGLPDMVFTANAGLILKEHKIAVLSRFRHEERQRESGWFRDFFIEQGYRVYVTENDFEGAGDALFLGDQLIGGYGFRSDPLVYKEIEPALGKPAVLASLVVPLFYHLDTCFCPLKERDYLIFPAAFSAESLAAIRAVGGNEIVVPEDEALRFACNAVCLGDKVIMPEGCPSTFQNLQRAGYEPICVAMTEYMKAGGACKCLTLVI